MKKTYFEVQLPTAASVQSNITALLGLKKSLASHIRILFLIFTYFSINYCGYLLRSNFLEHKKINFRENTRFFIRDLFIRKRLGIAKIKKLSTNVTLLRFAQQVKKKKCWKTIYLLG